MSSVVIAGNTSGTVTLAAPDVAGTTTLTLPVTNGTLVTTASGQALTSPTITGTATLNGVNMTPYTMKNRIINGNMAIDQRNSGATVTPTASAYTLDRWEATMSAASKYSVYQNANSTASYVATGQYYSVGLTSLSAYTVGASEAFTLTQYIEGYNVADMLFGTSGAKTFTLSFWVYSTLAGTFGGAFQNSGRTRSYPFTYTISAANTWEYKTITVAGDTTGTWLTTNGRGLNVIFSLGTGATLSGTAGAWATATYYSATGATSLLGTNGAQIYLTGVQLELGSSATSFEWRPYGNELELCQRYYYLHASNNQVVGMGAYYTTTNVRIPIFFPTTMRTSPTLYSASGTDYYQIYRNNTGDPFNTMTQDGAGVNTTTIYNNTQIAAGTVGWAGDVNCNNASSYVAFQAEL